MCFTAQPKETQLPSHSLFLSLYFFLSPPSPQLATPRCVCCCLSNFQLAAEYENFVWANLLYGILIVFAQLKLETETRLESRKARKLAAENSKRKAENCCRLLKI